VQTGNSVHLHFNMWALYFSDDWKVTNELALNLGLRYDFQGEPYEEQDRLAWFNPTGQGAFSFQTSSSCRTMAVAVPI
jgi:outer membrane receptor for monomeric catechols